MQVLCKSDPKELLKRVRERIENGERHPAHQEMGDIESGKYAQLLGDGRITPLAIGGILIEVDTTDFSKVDYEELLREISTQLN